MRCPHCAAPDPGPELCSVCGERLDAAVAPQEHLEGLETMGQPTPDVATTRMADLVTTEEALGDVRVPEDDAADGPSRTDDGTVRCRACGVPNAAERTLCLACGVRL